MIKKTTYIVLAVAVITFIFEYLFLSPLVAWNALITVLIFLVNMLLLAFIWSKMLDEKPKTTAFLLAFVKYPALGLLIFLAAQTGKINPLGIALGICEFLLSIVLVMVFRR